MAQPSINRFFTDLLLLTHCLMPPRIKYKLKSLTANFEFIQHEEIFVIIEKIGVVVILIFQSSRPQEDTENGLGILDALYGNFVGKWFVIELILPSNDIKRLRVFCSG